MNSGFWLSTAILAGGVVVAAWLLPNRTRDDQVERDGTDPTQDLDDEHEVLVGELV